MRVVLIGKGQMLSSMIEGCKNCGGINIVGVLRYENLTCNHIKLFFRDFFRPSTENTLIKKYKLTDLRFKSLNSKNFREFLIKKNIDLMLVGTWKEKISLETSNIPRLASINIHPSLLPKYRGANPYFAAIKNRDKFSGFTFHLIDEKFDTGAILYQQRIDILPNYTSKELRDKTSFEVQNILPTFLRQLDNGEIKPVEQKAGTYCKNITRDDIMLDFDNETAEEISARIRALHPWLPAYVSLGNNFYIPNPYKISILNETVNEIKFNPNKNEIIAPCKDGKSILMKEVRKYKGKSSK